MLVSSKAEYGLRAICYLALQDKDRKIKIKEIAEKEDISARYLEQIFNTFKQAGFVKSIKGPHGGYVLIKSVESIRVADVLRLLEPALFENKVNENLNELENKSSIEKVLITKVWKKLDKSVVETLESIKLQEILEEYTTKNSYMYYI